MLPLLFRPVVLASNLLLAPFLPTPRKDVGCYADRMFFDVNVCSEPHLLLTYCVFLPLFTCKKIWSIFVSMAKDCILLGKFLRFVQYGLPRLLSYQRYPKRSVSECLKHSVGVSCSSPKNIFLNIPVGEKLLISLQTRPLPTFGASDSRQDDTVWVLLSLSILTLSVIVESTQLELRFSGNNINYCSLVSLLAAVTGPDERSILNLTGLELPVAWEWPSYFSLDKVLIKYRSYLELQWI